MQLYIIFLQQYPTSKHGIDKECGDRNIDGGQGQKLIQIDRRNVSCTRNSRTKNHFPPQSSTSATGVIRTIVANNRFGKLHSHMIQL